MEEEGRKSPPPAVTSHSPMADAAGKYSLPLELKNPERGRGEKRERGEGGYGFLLLSTFLAAWESG